MARKQKFPKLTPAEAHAALRWLHALGRVTSKDIVGALTKREELVAEIRATLKRLGGQGTRFLTGLGALRRPQVGKTVRRKASAKARAAWALQGRYIGAVRQLSPRQRLQVRKIREANGVGAAIAAAKRMGARLMPQPSGRRHFKTLSEAIRAGCQRHPLPPQSPDDPAGGPFGRGALQAAWLAQFPEEADVLQYLSLDLVRIYPELADATGNSCPYGPNTSCPEWPKRSHRTLEQAIIHLEDVHGREREEIARWLVANGY